MENAAILGPVADAGPGLSQRMVTTWDQIPPVQRLPDGRYRT